METVARILVAGCGIYLSVGAVFAVPFLVRGIERIDPSARGASVGFRLIVVPGVLAFWPLLGWRWVRGAGAPPDERSAHLDATRRQR